MTGFKFNTRCEAVVEFQSPPDSIEDQIVRDKLQELVNGEAAKLSPIINLILAELIANRFTGMKG